MNLTRHAQKRKQQRGFSISMLRVIENHGRYKKAPHGVMEVFFGKKEAQNLIRELKRDIQLVERLTGSTIIFSENEIITMYKATG
jgi:hypothetical protein